MKHDEDAVPLPNSTHQFQQTGLAKCRLQQKVVGVTKYAELFLLAPML